MKNIKIRSKITNIMMKYKTNNSMTELNKMKSTHY